MSYTTHEENVIYDIRDYLDANLDTYLTGIETDKADGIALPDIRQYYVGDKDLLSETAFPAAYMVPGAIAYETLTMNSVAYRPQIVLSIAVRAQRTRELTVKALRYVAAVRMAIDADRTAGAKVDRMALSSINFFVRPEAKSDHIIIEAVIDAEIEVQR